MSILVFGHKCPDTDTIISAIALADLKIKLSQATKPYSLGPVNPETSFVLNRFGLAAPEVISSVASQRVMVVDTSDLAQLPNDIKQAKILAVYDHHKLGDLTTSSPLEMWVAPVGCTGTIIYLAYKYYGIEIPKNIAGALICAILSDTVLFKSPTYTAQDKSAVEFLAKTCDISDFMALGMEMFLVKSAISGTLINELIFRDYKDFNMSGKKVGIGQLEVVDLSIFENIKDDLFKEIQKIKDDGRHSVLLMLTDIIKEGTEMLIVSEDSAVVHKAFHTASGKSVWLPGVLSRKKDVVPKLEKVFAS
ncbi:putative manganese-dependent inorganic pyrophosphatase [Desulfovibrionales bacterium]